MRNRENILPRQDLNSRPAFRRNRDTNARAPLAARPTTPPRFSQAARRTAAKWTFEHHYRQLLSVFAAAIARKEVA